MAGKVLFVDDECMSLKTEHTITNALIKIGDAEEKANAGIYSFTSSFEDAVRTIKKAGNGEDYSWFFIDRNLEGFDDIKNIKNGKISSVKIDDIEFNEEFFNCFEKFEGDYLYFLLRQAGVPVEKICFLTANDINSQKEDSGLRATPFLSEAEKPACIVKENKRGNACAGEDDPDSQSGEDEKELCEKINKTPQVQTRFKYREIFDNEKIDQLFKKTDLLNNFLDLLVKIDGGETPEPEDGITLRNMIEFIMQHIFNYNHSVRKILNNKINNYNNIPLPRTKDEESPDFRRKGRSYSDITQDDCEQFWWYHYEQFNHVPQDKDLPILISHYKYYGWTLYNSAENIASDIIKTTELIQKKLLNDNAVVQKLWETFLLSQKRPIYSKDDLVNQGFSDLPVQSIMNDIFKKTEVKFIEIFMQSVFSSKRPENATLPPKFIFSYIDNIYTVTSEWSAHGKNQQKTDGLSMDGWKALVYGMVQILQWFAKEHPNIP